MKGLIKRIFTIGILIITLLLSGVLSQAASEKQQALQAYSSFLENKEHMDISRFGQHYGSFALAYIDDDNIPELIYSPGDIYTYKNGNIVQIGDGYAYYSKTGIFLKGNARSGGMGQYSWSTTEYNKINGTSYTNLLRKFKHTVYKKTTIGYTYKEKNISKKTFDKKLHSLNKGRKLIKFDKILHKNNSSSRHKYFNL